MNNGKELGTIGNGFMEIDCKRTYSTHYIDDLACKCSGYTPSLMVLATLEFKCPFPLHHFIKLTVLSNAVCRLQPGMS